VPATARAHWALLQPKMKEQALGRSPDSACKEDNELIDFIEALPEQNLD
jgi:hypothetical protein